MKIISFATLKGGVGKSSVLFQLAGFLGCDNKKVLVIDADPQGNASNNFGVNKNQPGLLTMKDILENQVSMDDCIVKAPIPQLKTIDIIPSSIFLTYTEFKLAAETGREMIFSNYLSDSKSTIQDYDYIFIDTNPSMSLINQNMFVASTDIFIVSDISMNSYEGADLFSNLWKHISKQLRLEPNISAFIINNADFRLKLTKEYIDFCEESELTKELLVGVIPASVKVKESEIENLPLSIYSRSGEIFKQYSNLYNKLNQKGLF